MKKNALFTALVMCLAPAMAIPATAGEDVIANACMKYTLYSDANCACVADDAAERLDEGQYAYLSALWDKDVSASDVRREHDLGLGDLITVDVFMKMAGPRCMLRR